MSRDAAQLFFSMLTIVALAGSVALLGMRLAARRSAGAAEIVDGVRPVALWLAALVAITCMLGSLFFSEIAPFLPCELCWFQRICMYPLALVLTIAAVRRDRKVNVYVVPLAAIGAVIALYHWLLERFPDTLDAGVCSTTVPCDFIWFERFGFVTLPFMALVGFVSIITLTTFRGED